MAPTYSLRVSRPLGVLVALLLLLTPPGPSALAQPASDLSAVRIRASQGDLEAQNTLGNAYTNALLGLARDHGEALRWYRAAAEQGFAPAQFNLGLAAELGRGIPKDEALAFRYYLQAAEQGFPPALFNVGNMYAAGRGVAQDVFEANLWYRQAAEKGLSEAQYNLALSYETGRGLKQDQDQAARWYRQAANRGFPLAQYNLGLMMEEGRGVPKDQTAAAGLYLAAASQGVAAAQNNYGLMLFEGSGGLPRDPVEAAAWLEIAVLNGFPTQGRDTVVNSLSPTQITAVTRRVAELRDRRPAKPDTAEQPAASSPLPPVRQTPSDELATLQTQLQEATRGLARLQQLNRDLTESNRVLQMRNTAAAQNDGNTTVKSRFGTNEPAPERIITSLKRDNATLKEELDQANRELLWLRRKEPSGGADDLAERLRRSETEAARLAREVGDLEEQLKQARTPIPGDGDSLPLLARLEEQNATLRRERDDLEKWVQALERTMSVTSAAHDPADATATGQAVEAQLLNVQRLTDENRRLNGKIKQMEQRLSLQTAATPDRLQTDRMMQRVLELEQRNVKAAQDQETMASLLTAEQANAREARERIKDLGRELARARQQFEQQSKSLAALRNDREQARSQETSLNEAEQTIERLTSHLAELKEARSKLEIENNRLAQAGQQRDETARMTESLRQENRELLARNTELTTQLQSAREAAAASPFSSRLQVLESRLTRTEAELDAARIRAASAEAGLAATAGAPSDPATAGGSTPLAQELENMGRLLESYRADLHRLRQEKSSDRATPTPDASSNSAVLASQLAQTRKELDLLRLAQTRESENIAVQERRQAALITRLQSENSALMTRLAQVAGNPDQVAPSLRPPSSSVNLGERQMTAAPSRPGTVPAPAVRYHQVAEGDSLYRISERYYGTPGRWQEITRANSDTLHGATHLRIGQQLKIP